MKFGFNRPSGFRGEDVWKCWHTTHIHTTEAYLYYKLTNEPKGSGELISHFGLFYAPPPESGGALCYTLRNFECPSVRPSVCPSVSAHHHSCIGNSSYSFRPILLKLYRCFKDGLKICILFFQNPEIIFYHFFPIFNLRHFSSPYTTDMYMEYVPCIGNSSYSFWRILLKLYKCFKDGLKICILFFQNPEIIFYHFLRIFNLDIFRALILQICIWSMYLVSATPLTVFGESFWNFTDVLRMVWRYAYCFFQNTEIIFYHFFRIFNLDIFSSPYTTDMYMEYIPCIGNSSYSFWRILLKLYSCFQDGLKICILFSQDPEIIFFAF